MYSIDYVPEYLKIHKNNKIFFLRISKVSFIKKKKKRFSYTFRYKLIRKAEVTL